MTAPRNVAILLFPDVELLDFCGPFEVFSVAARWGEPPPFSVRTIAEKPGPVRTSRDGLSVNPDHLLKDGPPPELLVIPGGQGTRREMHNTVLIDWIKKMAGEVELVLSVCTGALLLGKAGLLDGLAATTHHGALDLLRQTAPKAKIQEGPRYIDNGKVIVSAGIAAGIDMSLHVVARLLGSDHALKTARQMEYPYLPTNHP